MNYTEHEISISPRVFLIDDDEPVLTVVSRFMKSAGLDCQTYSSAQDYLDDFDPETPGCVVTDLIMPGLSGLDLQKRLSRQDGAPPVILITAHGDVRTAVQALKDGAVDFIEKPFVPDVLISAVNKAIAHDLQHRREQVRVRGTEIKLAKLTERELEVMTAVVSGKPNKIIAADMNLNIKTVEYHRSNVMKKMEVVSVAALVEMVLEVRHTKRST